MHHSKELIKNTMAPVAAENKGAMEPLESQLNSLPSDENFGESVMRDESFDDYVNQMSGSVQFDEADDMPAEVEEVLKKPETAVHEPDGAHVREEHWNPKRSFLAETPYFAAFVEKEMHELGIATSILTDISERTKTFTNRGNMMADAAHCLSLACRLRTEEAAGEERRLPSNIIEMEMEKRRHAIGPEIADLLGVLGDVSFMSAFVFTCVYMVIKLMFLE